MANGRKPPDGRQGIVAAATVAGRPTTRPEHLAMVKYADGTTANWKWELKTAGVDLDGFVKRSEMFRVLGYEDGYTMRGFGSRWSGVRTLSSEQYEALYSAFKKHERIEVRALLELRQVSAAGEIADGIKTRFDFLHHDFREYRVHRRLATRSPQPKLTTKQRVNSLASTRI